MVAPHLLFYFRVCLPLSCSTCCCLNMQVSPSRAEVSYQLIFVTKKFLAPPIVSQDAAPPDPQQPLLKSQQPVSDLAIAGPCCLRWVYVAMISDFSRYLYYSQ